MGKRRRIRSGLWVMLALGLASCNRLLPFGTAAPGEDGGSRDLLADRDSWMDGNADSGPPDAVSPFDLASPCAEGFVWCQGQCQQAADCTACSDKLLCKPLRRCVPSCLAGCTDLAGQSVPIECFACDTSQNNEIGTCEPNDKTGFCLNSAYVYNGKPGEHCDCSGTRVENCTGLNQVCIPAGSTDWCVTCGEVGKDYSGDAINTQGLACKNGKTCDLSGSIPQCK